MSQWVIVEPGLQYDSGTERSKMSEIDQVIRLCVWEGGKKEIDVRDDLSIFVFSKWENVVLY